MYAYQRGFAAAFEKYAAPAWAKRFPDLTPASQQRLLPTIEKLREVRPLGRGGERISDLVVHPQHGLAVRKTPLIDNSGPGFAENVIANRKNQQGMEMRLRELAQGAGPFAHIISSEPSGVAYYQYAPGVSEGAGLAKQMPRLEKEVDRTSKAFRTAMRAKAPDDIIAPLHAAMVAADKAKEDVRYKLLEQVPPPPGAAPVLEALKKEYPGLHDIRRSNIVGGKIVDMSPGNEKVVPRTRDVPRDPVGHSKRLFFGSPTPAPATAPVAKVSP